MKLSSFRIFQRIVLLALWLMAGLILSRLLLVVLFADRVLATEGLNVIISQGLRFDLVLLGLIFVLPAVLLPWLHLGKTARHLGAWAVPLFLALAVALAFFTEALSAPFIGQFDSRPNALFVETLAHPGELLATVSATQRWLLFALTLATAALGWGLFRWLRRDPAWETPVSLRFCVLMTPLLLVLFTGMIRSTLAHRPVSPGTAAFSSDTMVNTLPLNSPYLVLHSIYERRRDAGTSDLRYGWLPDDEVVEIMLREAQIPPAASLDPAVPSLHYQQATVRRPRPLNLVMIVLEGVGAEHVSALGGQDLAPTLDSLAERGIWLERLYATGMRSDRGLEALVSGFTPSRNQAALKAPEARQGFFTIAAFLGRQGYDTSFLFGGDSQIDNMGQFFLSNGFQTVIDEEEFDDPVFRGARGVSDEDLFQRAHERFSQAREPFFSLVFTSSNREPFDIPPDRVASAEGAPGTGEPPGRATAIRYSDRALGRFLDQASEADYWENTVFLVVANRNTWTGDGQLVPVERFRVPGVILGRVVRPRRIPGIVSQIDLVPTLLSIIGVDGVHPAIGRDLTRPSWRQGSGRAVMQFHELQAYIEDDQAVILQPDLPPRSFHLRASGAFDPLPSLDARMRRKALAYARWGPWLLENRAYRLPPEATTPP